MERRYASTAHVAAALGVSTTTVKRWVDDGVLPAQKTAGGHRRLLVADVLRVAQAGDFPHLDLTRLGAPRRGRRPPPDPGELARQLAAALRHGDAAQARRLLQAYRGGLSMAALADAVIAPVMGEIGHAWEAGRIDVLHEHRASLACAAALHALKADLEGPRKEGRPVAVGGGPEGDPYLLPNLLAELVLMEQGWEVVNLGPNTPLASFGKALAEFRPRLLWLSASHLRDAEGFSREYRQLYRDAERAGAAVVIGGQALTADVRADLPYTAFGDRMANLAAFAGTLHPTKRRRRRGEG